MKYDIDAIHGATSGREIELLIAAGFDPAVLDGSHHPCPKCVGTDRFRLLDKSRGAVFCNQCFKEKNGDYISAVGWLRGLSMKDAIAWCAEWAGVKPSGNGKRPYLTSNGELNESVVDMFLAYNEGITATGLKRIGAYSATLIPDVNVVAIPGFDQAGKDLINICMSWMDKELTLFTKAGKQTLRKKTVGKGAALLGKESLTYLKTEKLVDVCWKVEGPTDLMSLLSVLPEPLWGSHVAISNAHGASEKPSWMAVVAARAKQVWIIHDNDETGQKGAFRWSEEITAAGAEVKNIQLPDDYGDLREFIHRNGEHAMDRLLELADKTEVHRLEGTGDPILDTFGELMHDLGGDIMAEDRQGRFLIYSHHCQKTTLVINPEKTGYCGYLKVFGRAFEKQVNRIGESGKKYGFEDVRDSILIAGSLRRINEDDLQLNGPGLWLVQEDDKEMVVIVNGHGIGIYRDGRLDTEDLSPRVGRTVFEVGGQDWIDFDRLEGELARVAERSYCEEVWIQLRSLINRWSWKYQGYSVEVLTGLVGATFCQTFWDYRPLVAIRGDTNTGKTVLMEVLFGREGGGIFGNHATRFQFPTSAGVRQAIRKSARPFSIDEWDSYSQKKDLEMLRLLRTTTRGGTMVFGTASHRAREFGLSHIVWATGIHMNLPESQDENRFLKFELIKPTEERSEQYRKTEPTREALRSLSYALTAMAIRYGPDAVRLHSRAVDVARGVDLDLRVMEGLCVPAAFIAATLGEGVDEAVRRAEDWGTFLAETEEEEFEANHAALFREILDLPVKKSGTEVVSAATILGSPYYWDTAYETQLEQQLGLRAISVGKEKYLAINPTKVARQMAGSSPKSVTQLLVRLSGARRDRVMIAGSQLRAVLIPWSLVNQVIDRSSD